MLNNIIKLLILTVLLPTVAFAQFDLGNNKQTIDYTKPKEYIIGGIALSGNNKLDENAVLLLAGLEVGDKITIPSDKTKEVVKRFWDQELFSDVKLLATRIEENFIFLELSLDELPKISKFSFPGLSKNEIKKIKENLDLYRGRSINKNLYREVESKVNDYFVKKGFYNVETTIKERDDSDMRNGKVVDIVVDKNKRVKVGSIKFHGNESFSDEKLRRKMKSTKEKRFWRIFKTSKYIEENFEEDKASVLALYNQKGFRDAKIVNEKVVRDGKKLVRIDLDIEEGKKYYFRNISWVGNTKYTAKELSRTLGIKNGDTYDEKLLNERLEFSFSSTDIKSLYMNDGYLFFDLKPVEVLVENDSIDLEMRMNEGQQAFIRKVVVKGNTKTRDDVIYRELRTKPGELFRRSDIIRTQQVLSSLRYFDPQQIGITPKPDPATGMVDIEYSLEETSSDQIQLQGAWGGASQFIGTLALNLNNFSMRNFFNKKAWQPLPSGDGQKLSLNVTSNGSFYQSYGASFTEPWLGGRKPNSLTVGVNHFVFKRGEDSKISSVRGSVSLGKRLKFPDDFFTLSHTLTLQRYKLVDWTGGIVDNYTDGLSHNFNYRVAVSRNSVFEPFFPTSGSTFTLSGEFTPPYSLVNGKNYSNLTPQERYKWLEYYKIKFSADWYTNIIGKFVFRTHFEMGSLSPYQKKTGLTPFERFHLGGDGLQTGGQFDGSEVIALRGYNDFALNPQASRSNASGAYVKYYLEARYPFVKSPQSTIYGLAFAEAGKGFENFSKVDIFGANRSAGAGIRVIMPMLGILGVDFAYGFDPIYGKKEPSGWQTHFILGQQF
jgi:outer membrane protein insertion porin family